MKVSSVSIMLYVLNSRSLGEFRSDRERIRSAGVPVLYVANGKWARSL